MRYRYLSCESHSQVDSSLPLAHFSQKGNKILSSLLLLGVLLERSPQHPALIATLLIQKRQAIGDGDATPHKVIKAVFELAAIGEFLVCHHTPTYQCSLT